MGSAARRTPREDRLTDEREPLLRLGGAGQRSGKAATERPGREPQECSQVKGRGESTAQGVASCRGGEVVGLV